jgi:hypothetical protein
MDVQYNVSFDLIRLIDEEEIQIVLLAHRKRVKRHHRGVISEIPWYVKPRSNAQVDLLCTARMVGDGRFRSLYRMGRDAFMSLLAQLSPYLVRPCTNFRKSVDPFVQLLVFLYYVGATTTMTHTGEHLGLGTSTVSKLVHRVTAAIVEHMRHEYIFLPGPQEAVTISAAF